MIRKLKNSQGETLVEVLASFLICFLSVLLLFGAAMASTRMNRIAQEADSRYYQDLSRAERQQEDAPEPDVFTPPEGTPSAIRVENRTPPSPGKLPPPPITLEESDGLRFYGSERLLSYALGSPPASGEGGGP